MLQLFVYFELVQSGIACLTTCYFCYGLADIDECKTGNHTCINEHNCRNTIGSYECFCPKGQSGKGTKEDGCHQQNAVNKFVISKQLKTFTFLFFFIFILIFFLSMHVYFNLAYAKDINLDLISRKFQELCLTYFECSCKCRIYRFFCGDFLAILDNPKKETHQTKREIF